MMQQGNARAMQVVSTFMWGHPGAHATEASAVQSIAAPAQGSGGVYLCSVVKENVCRPLQRCMEVGPNIQERFNYALDTKKLE